MLGRTIAEHLVRPVIARRNCLRSLIRITAWVVLLLLSASAVNAAAQPTSLSPSQTQVVDTVKAIFAAAEADDLAKFHGVTAPTFYIFDNGARFDGDAIMTLIKRQHAAGKTYEWNVTDPDVHINGKNAWVAYVNRGSVGDASGKKDMQWLESAVLQKQGGKWKIVFMQSTRVPATTPETHPK